MGQIDTTERINAGISRGDEIRKSAENRKKRKKRRDRILVLSLILLVTAAFAAVAVSMFFKVSSVCIENSGERYSNEQIAEIANISADKSMFALNTAAIEERIEQKLPYIGSAKIKRKLPDTIVISVEYTSAALAVSGGAGYTLLDVNGKVLENNADVLSDYVAEIFGVTINLSVPGDTVSFFEEEILSKVTSIAAAFKVAGINNITVYNFTDTANVIVEVDYRIDVKLGSAEDAEKHINFGKEVIKRTLSSGEQGKMVIDLTTDKTAYVRSQKDIDAAIEAASIAEQESKNAAVITTTPDEPSSTQESEQE